MSFLLARSRYGAQSSWKKVKQCPWGFSLESSGNSWRVTVRKWSRTAGRLSTLFFFPCRVTCPTPNITLFLKSSLILFYKHGLFGGTELFCLTVRASRGQEHYFCLFQKCKRSGLCTHIAMDYFGNCDGLSLGSICCSQTLFRSGAFKFSKKLHRELRKDKSE